jgi:outer membrane immunogenic protein
MTSAIMGLLGALLGAAAACAQEASADKAFVSAPTPALSYEGLSAGPKAGSGAPASSSATFAPAGAYGRIFLGVLQAGYDWRRGPLVLGLVGDVWSNPEDTSVSANGSRSRLDTQLSLRGRIGYRYGGALFFLTGGVEAAYFTHDYQAPLVYKHYHYAVAAPTAGVGVEYALDRHWSINAGYRAIGPGAAPQAVNFAPLGAKAGPRRVGGAGTVGLRYRFD